MIGEGVKPETVEAIDLADLLYHLKRTFVATVDPPFGTTNSNSNAAAHEEQFMSLVSIDEGSNCLTFSFTEKAANSAAIVVKSIAQNKTATLPYAAQHELYELSKQITKKLWKLEFAKSRTLDTPNACISIEKPIPQPARSTVRGSTTVFGQCVRVGGAGKPAASIRLRNRSDILIIEVSVPTAKKLAHRLYEDVAIKGTALWQAETWQILEFKADEIVNYQPSGLLDAFAEMAEVSQGAWINIDAEEFVNELRTEDKE